MHPKLAALAFLAACALPLTAQAAPQTTDFETTTVNSGFFNTFQQDGFNYALSGGSPPTWTTHFGAPLVGTGIRAFSGGGGDAQQGSITRIGGGTFTMTSLIVANYGNTAALTVRAFNGASQVFTTSIPASGSATVNFGNVVATEIRLNGTSANAGAEFGTTFGIDNFTIDVANVAPTLANIEGNQVSYSQGGAAVILDSGTALTVADADSANFNGGALSVSIFSGGVGAEDVLEVAAVGPITLSGVDVVHSGTTIGTITGSGVGGNPLVITLNANATPARTQDLGRAIRFDNTNNSNPGVNLRRILWSLTDGGGAPARSYRSAVKVLPLIAGGSVVRVEFSGATPPNPLFDTFPKVFTAGGFSFRTGDQNNATGCDVGCFGSNFDAPNSPGAQIQANGLAGLTTTIKRSDNATFTLVSLVVGNLSSANVTVTARNGATVLDTRTLSGGAAQQLSFANLTVDEVRLVGNATITGNLVQGWIDDLVVAVANVPAAISNLGGNTATYTQLGSAVTLDTGTAATVVDPDSANFDTGSLSISITGNLWSAQDVLGVGNIGTITTSGANVLDSGTTIGTITANGSGGNPLTVTFNANATPARVQNLVRALTYSNSNINTGTGVQGPDLGNRTVQVVINDGDGAPPGTVTTTVQVRPAALPSNNQVEVNFNGLSVAGTPSTLSFQNYTFTVAGGLQPYLSGGSLTPSGPSLRAGATEIVTQTLTVRRTDSASFLLASLVVANLSQESTRTIRSFNGASTVQTITLPAGATQRVVFNNSAVTRIEISGSTGLTTAGLAEVDDVAILLPLPDLSIGDVIVTEGNAGITNAAFTVSLSAQAGPGGVTFDIATANNSATAGTDYVLQSLTGRSIPAGSSSYTFTVQVNGDLLNELNESYFVNVTNVVGAIVVDGQGQGTITNDDPLPSLSINDVSVSEGNSGTTNAVFNVTLSAASGQIVSVNYASADGAATQPSDYTSTSGTLTFTPGQTTRTVTVPVNGDTTIESDETYFVNLSGATNATIADNQGLGTILNDDTPALSVDDVSIAEGDAGTKLLTFTVTRSANTTAVTFDFATADGTAANGSDYVSASGSGALTLGGANTTTISVTLNGDAVYEANETFVVNLSNPSGATISDAQGLGTIQNDDATPTLAINDVSIVEGNSGTQSLNFTVTRSGLTDLPASFNFASADDTAIAPGDYTAIASTPGSIAAGGLSASATIAVSINGDNVAEVSERLFINLSAAGNATFGDNQGIGTIQNDDTAGITVVQTGGSTNVAEGGATDSYTVTLTSQPTTTVTIALTTNQVTVSAPPAINGSDKAVPAPGATLTFTAANWNLPQMVTVTAIDDAIAEGPHTGSVTSIVSSGDPGYAGFLVAPISVAITDNDMPGITLTQSGGTTTATEGGASDTYSVVLTSQPTADVVIALTGTQVTATPTPLTFNSGNWNLVQTVTVTAIDDAVAEGTHSGSVTSLVTSGDSNYNGFVVGPISVSITDNDTAGVTIAEAGGTAVTEGGAIDTYTAVLTSQPTADVIITPSSGAEVGVSPASRTFTAANWNLPQTFTVTAVDDAIVEGAENATITHTSASADPNYQGATVASVTAAITDNDSATVQFAPNTLSQSEATSPMAFTVTLSAPVQSGVTLTVNSTPGTAGAADFTAIGGGTVTFAANTSTSQTVNVTINNDALDENDETYTLTLSGLTAVGNVSLGTAGATGTILDDDPTPTLSVTSPSLSEGNSGTSVMNFTVSLSAVSGRAVSFNAATLNGTATTADGDYVALPATPFMIAAGATTATIPVIINGDTPYEGDETFTVQITGVSNATPIGISGTGTILDDDQQPTTTTITGDTPDPTVVGQPYTVSATVVAQTSSPLGTVTISDGSASCNGTLTAGTAPNSTMSCLLSSTSAGAKTLTASYTPASSAFAASNGSAGHQVNPAATTISVSGPPRSRINQPASFSFVLGVTAPGAGTPTGTVTLSSGAASCTATLPATSCALTFTALGARTVTASYASDGNFGSSSSSGAGNAQTVVYALSDLSISKTDGIGYYEPGDLLVYSVSVRNLGPDNAANIRVVDTIPAGLADVVWSCDASGGGVCPSSGGAGNLDVVLANLRVGALLNFTFFGNVVGLPQQIANTAAIVLPADTTIEDPALGNNSATDTDQIDFTFRNGFEEALVSAPVGSLRVPGIALARSLGDEAQLVLSLDDAQGEALRIYARLHDNRLQYALARRASNGLLRLEAWSSLPGEPTLSWNARAVATGWVLESAQLR